MQFNYFTDIKFFRKSNKDIFQKLYKFSFNSTHGFYGIYEDITYDSEVSSNNISEYSSWYQNEFYYIQNGLTYK